MTDSKQSRSRPSQQNCLRSYPTSETRREIAPGQRKFSDRLAASMRGRDFFDGDRNRGYGGFKYDGRWKPVAEDFVADFSLADGSRVLQIQCEKGFLLHEFDLINPLIEVHGSEDSDYAIQNLHDGLRARVEKMEPTNLKYESEYFDLVIALGVVYTLNLRGAIDTLREITRVSRGNSFVTVASYSNEKDYQLMREWSLLGNLILLESEWINLFEFAGYTGSYSLVTASSLGVQLMKK